MAGAVQLVDVRAARDAEAVGGIEAAEADVAGGVQVDGEHMLLADAHCHLVAVAALLQNVGGEHLRGVVLRVGSEIAEELIHLGGGDAGDEGRAAPMVEQGAGEFLAVRRRELLDDKLAATEASLNFGVGGERSQKGLRRSVLRFEADVHGSGAGVEGGDGGRAGFAGERQWCEQKKDKDGTADSVQRSGPE